MIPQILLVGSFVQPIDEVLQKFTGAIGCNFMTDVGTTLCQKIPAMIHCVEHKGKILQAEGFLVVIAVH